MEKSIFIACDLWGTVSKGILANLWPIFWMKEKGRSVCACGIMCRVYHRFQQFFSHITITVYECSRELYAHFKIELPKQGRLVLALPNKSVTSLNLWPPVPRSEGYTKDGKKRHAITLLSIHTEFKFLFFFTFLEVQKVEHCRTVPDTVLMKHITEKGPLEWPVKFLNHHKDHYNL